MAANPPREFDLDAWLASVDGKTIMVDAPEGFPSVPRYTYMPGWARPHDEFYCAECEAMRFPVFDDPDALHLHCPVCGSEPGALALGTDGLLTDVEPNRLEE